MEWRVVPSQPHLEVSDEGLVRTKPFVGPMPSGGTRMYGGKEHRGVWDKRYKRYFIYSKKAGANLKIARLVCEAFHGPAPDGKPNVLHSDENSRNNRSDNLSWGTQEENLNAPGFVVYCKGRVGENSTHAKKQRAL